MAHDESRDAHRDEHRDAHRDEHRDEHRPLRADETSDETEGGAHVPSSDAARRSASRLDADDRADPHPDHVAGSDDAGAQGRDRDNGGWGDRGIGGGRAGGTGP